MPVLTCAFLFLQTSWAAAEIYTADGHQIEVTLVPEKPSIMLGEPAYLSFIAQNHSAQDLQVIVGGDYRNALSRPSSFSVTVSDATGKSVPQPNEGGNFGGLLGPQKIPAKGSYTFKLFLAHWATIKEPGTYDIVAKRTLRLGKYKQPWDVNDKTTAVEAQASTKIEIVPQDYEKMGMLISALGETILGVDIEKAEAAAYQLSAIDDERVIPYFLKTLDQRNYNLKYKALRVLARFNTQEALGGLKKGLETHGKDIANAATPESAKQLAGLIRHAAAVSLSQSPHPAALPFLIEQRHDASSSVRLTVVQAIGRLKASQAIPLLQEMARDKNQTVSDEAKRYLKSFSEPKPVVTP
ncbi:MAG TPA: HEAT repeat domain-containing protein [Abditibacteriaceae bacterium]